MEWTVGKQDPQVPLVVEQSEQSVEPPPGPETQSEETKIFEESIKEEKDIVDDDAPPAPPREPEIPYKWDFMRGGPQYEPSLFQTLTYREYPPPDRPYMHLVGFKNCPCLENATFFTDVTLAFNGGHSELNVITAPQLVQYIDSTALYISQTPWFNDTKFQKSSNVTREMNINTFMRAICFSVAFGMLNEWHPFVERSWIDREGFHGGRALRTVDSDSALPFLNYKGTESVSEKPHYNIAYPLFVHDHIENVAILIEAINDPSVFIYIHIDLASTPEYRQGIERLVANQTNMAIMPTSFAISWGHVSLVWSELRAVFDLLDMIDFDYMINLSGADYPLKTAKTMYDALERRPASNWVWHLDKGWDSDWRWGNMFHCQDPWWYQSPGRCVLDIGSRMGWREWRGLAQLFPYRYKSSQWKILHRNTIEWIRSSEAVKLLLMWAEHTWCPDEEVFATILSASPFVNQTYPDPKRLVWWEGGPHPHDWNMGDVDLIEEWQSHFFFIRKVWLSTDLPLKEVLDRVRERDEVSDELVTHFRDGIIPVD